MTEAIKILRHAESVLMKKVKAMKDGKPKYAANEKIRELRYAIDTLKQVSMEDVLDEEEETEFLTHLLQSHPPKAQA